MQKWECLFVDEPIPYDAQHQEGQNYRINGVDYSYQAGENFYTLMARLGQEGWEFVAISPNEHVLIFQRPLESA